RSEIKRTVVLLCGHERHFRTYRKRRRDPRGHRRARLRDRPLRRPRGPVDRQHRPGRGHVQERRLRPFRLARGPADGGPGLRRHPFRRSRAGARARPAAWPAPAAGGHAALVRLRATQRRQLRAARLGDRVRRPPGPGARPGHGQRGPLAQHARAHHRTGDRMRPPARWRRWPVRVRALRHRPGAAPRIGIVRSRTRAPPRRRRHRTLDRQQRTVSRTMRQTLLLYAIRLQFLIQRMLAPERAARRAGALFCQPMGSSRRRARLAPTLDAVEHDLDIDGTRIHAYTWGDPSRQPYVLFAHGWSSHGTRIAPWLPALRAAGYAVVAFDQAWHGRSGGRLTT